MPSSQHSSTTSLFRCSTAKAMSSPKTTKGFDTLLFAYYLWKYRNTASIRGLGLQLALLRLAAISAPKIARDLRPQK